MQPPVPSPGSIMDFLFSPQGYESEMTPPVRKEEKKHVGFSQEQYAACIHVLSFLYSSPRQFKEPEYRELRTLVSRLYRQYVRRKGRERTVPHLPHRSMKRRDEQMRRRSGIRQWNGRGMVTGR